jgi:hypothetical protein
MNKLIPILLALFSAHTLYAETNIPSTITANTTLLKAESPYLASSSITINAGIVLTIEPGVTIKFASLAGINVNGTIVAVGTETDSITFQSNVVGQNWGTINSNNGNIVISYSKVFDNKRFVNATGGDSIVISHCNIISNARGYGEDCIAVHDAKKVTINNIILKGAGGSIAEGIKNDAIDLDNVDSCFISNSHIYNFSDDAIDIGTETKYALINQNIIHNSNFGISIGESTIAYLKGNITYNNDAGIQVHSGATIFCENNTIFGNTVGIECYHSEEGDTKQTGGIAVLVNTIFSENESADITSQSSSSVTISYSISDKSALEGSHNLFGNPYMVDPANGDFRLKSFSPCINSGSPEVNIYMGASSEIIDGIYITDINNVFSVYPNPVNNFLKINSNKTFDKVLDISIYSMDGKLALQRNNFEANQSIDIQALPSGIYFIKINNMPYIAKSIKFIKQ